MHVVKVCVIFLLQINVSLMDLREAKTLPVDSLVASRTDDKVQLGQSSRSKKLRSLFLGHFWTKI